jgi:hypothetical protein
LQLAAFPSGMSLGDLMILSVTSDSSSQPVIHKLSLSSVCIILKHFFKISTYFGQGVVDGGTVMIMENLQSLFMSRSAVVFGAVGVFVVTFGVSVGLSG